MTRLAAWRDARRVRWLDTLSNDVLRFTYETDVAQRDDPTDAVSVRWPVRDAPSHASATVADFVARVRLATKCCQTRDSGSR